jgi:hypothetical protein
MDSSKFYLWRACFSFFSVDGLLAEKEKKWIEEKYNFLKFTEEQKVTLLNDFKAPPKIEDLLPNISKPSDRAFLLDQMRVISHIDGLFSPEEKRKIDEVKNYIFSKINLDEVKAKVAEDELSSYHEDEVYKVHNKDSYFENLHRKIQRIMNPGDYKFPQDK